MKIYKRYYDNPKKKDGSLKENELLGDFTIIEALVDGGYSSIKIGASNDVPYLIIESEVTGHNGGTRVEAFKLESLQIKSH